MSQTEFSVQNTDNQHIQNDFRTIKRLIAASMDGITAANLRKNGLNYNKNLGVALPRLREIASDFAKNTPLATELWQAKSRETMLVATMLVEQKDVDRFSVEIAENLHTIELAEMAAKELFARANDADLLLMNLAGSEEKLTFLAACHMATRTCRQLKNETLIRFVEILAKSDIDLATANAAFNLMLAVGECRKEIAPQLIGIMKNSDIDFCQRIAEQM